MLALLTFTLMPVMSLVCSGIAIYGVARGNDDLAAMAALDGIAISLATLACWFVL